MSDTLDGCRVNGGLPTTEQRNALVREAASRRVEPFEVPDSGSQWRHNWKVLARRYPHDPRVWIVDVGAGCVNDREAVIRYTANDERWLLDESGRSPVALARRLGEPSPPVLFATAPADSSPGSFARVSDSARPAYFRTRSMWRYELYRSSVVVSGTPPPTPDVLLDIPDLPVLPTLVGLLSDLAFRETLASIGLQERYGVRELIAPYVVACGRFPANLDGQQHHRIADLWLLRRPGASPSRDTVLVQQRTYWSLQAFSILEDAGLLAILPVIQATSTVGNLVAQDIFALLFDSAKIRWWSKG